MVPRLTRGGHSFKGAALYYLHDKRLDGERVRLTTERVSWTETRNLPTDDPQRAWRMMAHTASQQAALKDAAGIKATGRKLENPVLAYSLSWHPEENPDRAEMIRAAEDSLKVLGLDQHQVVLVAHHDEPHPHVHIMVNRVSPIDGRAAPLSKSKLVLSQWAEAYEKAQGLIRCEERVKNNAHREIRKDFDRATADKKTRADFRRAANQNRKAYEAQRTAAKAIRTNRQRAHAIKLEQLARDRALSERSKAIYARHRQQWQALQKAYKTRKAAIAAKRDAAVTAAIEAAKAARKSGWRAFFGDQRKEEREFWRNEKTMLGRVWNSVRLVAETPVSQHGPEHRGNLSRAFNLIVSQKGRHDALAASQEDQKRLRSEASRSAMRHVAKLTRDSFKAEYQQGWASFQNDREALLRQQESDRNEIKQSWQDWRAEKAETWRAFHVEEERLTERLGQAFGNARGQSQERGEDRGRERTRDQSPPDSKPGGRPPGR